LKPPAASTLKMLLSPLVNVTVGVKLANPPGAINGNGEPNPLPLAFGGGGNVTVTRFLLTGVTLPAGTVKSGMPSPFVSKATVAVVVIVMPGRAGTLAGLTPPSGFALSPVLVRPRIFGNNYSTGARGYWNPATIRWSFHQIERHRIIANRIGGIERLIRVFVNAGPVIIKRE